MKLRITATIAALAFSAAASAATSPPPQQILCTVDEQHRAGLEKLDTPGSEAFLFKYGGKVTITKKGSKSLYTYGKGQHFYNVKDKTPFSNEFLSMQKDLFLNPDPDWSDNSDFLYLSSDIIGSTYHIDMKTYRFFGYLPEFGAVRSFAGSCTILKK